MNCKQGDLAYTVAPYCIEGRGRIVRVLHLSDGRMLGDFIPKLGRVAWVCEGDIVTEGNDAYRKGIIADECLRPIRDNPGQDETLTWAPVPKKVEA